ncbi:serine/threonine-protein phosphatase 2A 65 kDa regulatory subunit A beta isoform-like [Coccinella septempunctata]|uniref:serine/threonine-protein phosphatase 2A 65 kDa regulatory subunit A beta isoform-like n=1 Tax=Coccinella septempunctata TaxID=41139 RepID=UPI001D073D98|nr:serine/threonine-protein phosphatase 2A 65 kDa regulatory subunit A beta isoform-like [Coccinella septempunctata]
MIRLDNSQPHTVKAMTFSFKSSMEDISKEEITSQDLALFKDALTGAGCDDIELKLYTIKRIATIAKILGPEKTVEDLLHFIDSNLGSLEDEVLCALVEELELFLPLVGGPDHCYELFSILLRISRSVDETLVRNRAVEAIKKLLKDIDQQLTEKFLVSSLVGNSENIWFQEKCSTLSLIPVCYPKASPENKILLRHKYCQIYEDNSSLVRKLAAIGLPEFINVLEIEHVLKEFIPLLNMIVEDDQEIVRMNAVEVALSIALKSKNQEVRNDMFEIVKKQSENSSWRIRQKVATTINYIASVFAEEDFIETLLEMYDNLINDSETEVRMEAVLNLYNFANSLHSNLEKIRDSKRTFQEVFLRELMPSILSITTDASNDVQVAFSSVILSLGLLIPDDIFKDTILSIVVNGLEKDKPLLFKENILMNLGFLPKDVDLVKSLTSIKSIIKHILLTSETSWRTRRSLLVSFVHVSKFCSAEYFQNNLLVYYILLLKDNIYAVRRAATLILPILTKRFGVRWFIQEVMPQIMDILKSKKYLMRYVVLFCIQELVFPTILVNDKSQCGNEIYIRDIKELIEKDEKKYGKLLCRISSLNRKLKESLDKEPFKEIITTYSDEYNISEENVRIYSEELLDSIMKNDEAIFSVESSEVEGDISYLEGILILLNKCILNVLKSMLEDPTENIKDRVKYTLTRIKQFSNELSKELSSMWISDYTSRIEEVAWKAIDEELDREIDKAVIDSTNAEKIDTDLMDTISVDSTMVETGSAKIDIQKLEVFPNERLPSEEMHFEQMESLDEEKCKDSNC